MKEATGELNMTVITVVAIAAVAAFFYAFVWPSIRANITSSTHCASAFNCRDCQNGQCTCDYIDGNDTKTIKCPDASAN